MFNHFLKHSSRIFMVLITLTILTYAAADIVVSAVGQFNVIQSLDLQLKDLIMQARPDRQHTDQVAIIAIDDDSVKAIGRWPWPRKNIADLIDKLNDHYNAYAIGLDMVFSEKDNTDEYFRNFMNELKTNFPAENLSSADDFNNFFDYSDTLLEKKSNDRILLNTIQKNNNIVLGYFFNQDEIARDELDKLNFKSWEKKNAIENISFIGIDDSYMKESLEKIPRKYAPIINIFDKDLPNLPSGYFSNQPDEDGKMRLGYLVNRYNDIYLPSLDLQLYRKYIARDYADQSSFGDGKSFTIPLLISVDETGVQKINVSDKEIITNIDGSIPINFYGKSKVIPTYSYLDVINGNVPKERLDSKIVYIGVTDVGTADYRATPTEGFYPGVEVHATILNNLIAEDYFNKTYDLRIAEFIILLITAVLTIIMMNKLGIIGQVVFSLLLLSFHLVMNTVLFNNFQIAFNFIYAPTILLGNWLIALIYKTIIEERDKKFIRNIFGQYVSANLLDKIMAQSDNLKIGGERKELTVLFCDIAGFTSISENIDASMLSEKLNVFFEEMVNIIHEYDGTVDKFMGDCVMAFFGAPLDDPDHASKAVKAAYKMMRMANIENRFYIEEIDKYIQIRIGVNTGEAVVGNFGSEKRKNYTVIGDSVNTASRLEGLNKQFKSSILVGEDTFNAACENIIGRKVDEVKVVGKTSAVGIYDILSDDLSKISQYKPLIEGYKKAYELYRNRLWDEAIDILKNVINIYGSDEPSIALLKRCTLFKLNPPPSDWDGSFIAVTK